MTASFDGIDVVTSFDERKKIGSLLEWFSRENSDG